MWNAVKGTLVVVFALGVAASDGKSQERADSQHDPRALFDRRIMPIFESDQPSSCVQCHLAAVDLKNYILPSHEKTFVSLRDQGLIDVDSPERSKILTLIQMGDKDLDQAAKLIHEKMRRAEYEAFASWIEACCDDPQLRNMPPVSVAERARPDKPDAVIRHARKSRLVDSFARNVWSQRMRCFPCHTPHEIDEANPRHQAAIKTRGELEQKYDDEMVQRLDIFRETPEATLQYLVERSRSTSQGELPLLNLDQPTRSLLVLKPMSKLPQKVDNDRFEAPSYVEPVTHMGGLKMHADDQSYKSFVSWIRDYSNVVGNRYVSVDQLPADNWIPSNLVLRMTDVPMSWSVGVPVQLFVHEWSELDRSWEVQPIAFTQGTVTPRRIVNGTLFLLSSDESDAAPAWDRENDSLPEGRYLVRAMVDTGHRLAADPAMLLGDEDYWGQVEIPKARWREGFRRAEVISGTSLTK